MPNALALQPLSIQPEQAERHGPLNILRKRAAGRGSRLRQGAQPIIEPDLSALAGAPLMPRCSLELIRVSPPAAVRLLRLAALFPANQLTGTAAGPHPIPLSR